MCFLGKNKVLWHESSDAWGVDLPFSSIEKAVDRSHTCATQQTERASRHGMKAAATFEFLWFGVAKVISSPEVWFGFEAYPSGNKLY